MIVALLIGCSAPQPEPTSALDPAAFRFCHVAGADLPDAMTLCALLEDLPEERCPGLRASCDGAEPDESDPPLGCGDAGGAQPTDNLAGAPVAPPQEFTLPTLFDLSGLGSLARWIVAFLIGAMVLLLFRTLWGSFGRSRPPSDAPLAEPEPMEDLDVLPELPSLPSPELLAAARQALAEGRPAEAVLLARGAALRHLGGLGALRLHRARTDREYVRALRRQATLQGDLRTVTHTIESHRWGGDPVRHEGAERALAAAARLLAITAALWCLWLVPAHAQTPSRYEPAGDAALKGVLELHGYDVAYRLRSLMELDHQTDAVVIDLAVVSPTEEQWEHIRSWVEDGGIVMVGGWDDDLPFYEIGDRVSTEADDKVRLASPFRDAGMDPPVWWAGPDFVFDGGLPIAQTEEGSVVAYADVGDGVLVGIADARLLLNGAFVAPANERFLGDLLYLGQSLLGWPLPTPARVQLATLSTSGGAADAGSNPLSTMSRARLLPFVLQLLATWALLGLWRGWPFAPLRDPPEEGRLNFVEHVEALGTRWAQLGASRFAASRYAALWLGRLGPAGLQLAAERAGHTAADAAALVARIEARAASPEGENHPDDAMDMEELWTVTRRG